MVLKFVVRYGCWLRNAMLGRERNNKQAGAEKKSEVM